MQEMSMDLLIHFTLHIPHTQYVQHSNVEKISVLSIDTIQCDAMH